MEENSSKWMVSCHDSTCAFSAPGAYSMKGSSATFKILTCITPTRDWAYFEVDGRLFTFIIRIFSVIHHRFIHSPPTFTSFCFYKTRTFQNIYNILEGSGIKKYMQWHDDLKFYLLTSIPNTTLDTYPVSYWFQLQDCSTLPLFYLVLISHMSLHFTPQTFCIPISITFVLSFDFPSRVVSCHSPCPHVTY